MSDDSGSYMRFTSDHHYPSSRPHNKHLAELVVKKSELEGNVAERGINQRPPNPNADGYRYKRTLFDREPNDVVEGGTLTGGSVKNPGWDPRHPRLSRNPNWYQGRGANRAKEVGSILGTIALAAI